MAAGTEEEVAAGTGEEEQLGSCCNFPIPQGPFCKKKDVLCFCSLLYDTFLSRKKKR